MAEGDHILKGTASAPALFPVSSKLGPSSSMAPALFPSFASARSVFPIVKVAGPQQQPALQWLSNPSFSEVLLPHAPDAMPGSEMGHPRGITDAQIAEPASSSDLDVPAEEVKEGHPLKPRKRRKKKRRKKEEESGKAEKDNKKEPRVDADSRKIGLLDSTTVQRKAAVTNWANVSAVIPKEYYFDTHGDPNNLAFGSLYKMDIARYRRQEISGPISRMVSMQRSTSLDFEGDGLIQDEVLKAGRYWSLKFASLDRKRRLKRLQIHNNSGKNRNNRGMASLGQFVPLETANLPEEDEVEKKKEGETWHQYVTVKTKEFNQHTRERPQDESLWIAFAEFQDELMQATEKEAVIRQLVEKKIAILEKALNLNKDSEDLLTLYLETCRRHDDAGTLLSKWQHAVSSHSGSLRMWREFLQFRRSQFSTFSVSSLRMLYNDSLQALAAARNRLSCKVLEKDNHSAELVDAEQALVSVFVDLCRFIWQTGHHELAVGLFQAEIEYSLFAPPIQLSESSKRRLFEAFWRSGAHRFGEDDGLGWVTWLEKEEEQVQKAREIKLSTAAQVEEDQAGGWTGWSVPGEELGATTGSLEVLEDDSISMEEDVVDADILQEEELNEEEEDAVLLEKLGLSLDLSTKVEVKDSKIWNRWSEKEVQRDREQWLPLHPVSARRTYDSDNLEDGEEDQLERMVLFEDIQESLFTLHTQQARASLIYQLVDFCDGLLPQWCCSNSESYISKLVSLERLNGVLYAELTSAKCGEREDTLGKLLGDPSWYQESKGRARFLRNCLSLVRSVLPHDRFLLVSLLKAEDLANEEAGAYNSNRVASRALAKTLLKFHRQDLSMWGEYACLEAAAGNIAVARKVFDTALASLGALAMEAQRDAPFLYLAYAELELSQGSNETYDGAEKKALYILFCLGTGCVYSPQSVNCNLPATMLLKGHRGFLEHLQSVRISDRGNLTQRGAALISCAALFEQLTFGWEAAAAVFEEGLAMSLPDRRRQSLECELLFVHYVHLLETSKTAIRPGHLRSTILRGFGQYPRNTKLIGAYTQSASQSGMRDKLRWFFDNFAQRDASPILWLFALSSEMWRPGGGPRIHSLFERALASKESQNCVLLWRCYLAYEVQVAPNPNAARRVYFRAIHACPWSKTLWVDGFLMLSSILSAKEQSEFVEVMRDKGLRLRTDVYEILLEDEEDEGIS